MVLSHEQIHIGYRFSLHCAMCISCVLYFVPNNSHGEFVPRIKIKPAIFHPGRVENRHFFLRSWGTNCDCFSCSEMLCSWRIVSSASHVNLWWICFRQELLMVFQAHLSSSCSSNNGPHPCNLIFIQCLWQEGFNSSIYLSIMCSGNSSKLSHDRQMLQKPTHKLDPDGWWTRCVALRSKM